MKKLLLLLLMVVLLAVLLFGIVVTQTDKKGIVIKGCTFTEIDPNGVIKW